METNKNYVKELNYKTEADSQTSKSNSRSPKGKKWEEMTNLETGINMYTLLYIK